MCVLCVCEQLDCQLLKRLDIVDYSLLLGLSLSLSLSPSLSLSLSLSLLVTRIWPARESDIVRS